MGTRSSLRSKKSVIREEDLETEKCSGKTGGCDVSVRAETKRRRRRELSEEERNRAILREGVLVRKNGNSELKGFVYSQSTCA